MTEATQSLLPVTDEAIAALARQSLGEWLAWPDAPRDGPREVDNEQVRSWLSGLPNKLASLTNEAARHRISHSLPGDAIKKLAYRAYCAGFNDRPGDQFWNDREADFDAAIAALTPSALSGDAGEVEAIRQQIINTPETADFMAGVPIEAAHQRERWGASHDAGKSPFDWFWLVGYLAQKAASSAVAGDTQKAMHHTISTAAALANWHAALSGVATEMRPGIGPGNGGEKPGSAYALAAALPSHPGDAGEGE